MNDKDKQNHQLKKKIVISEMENGIIEEKSLDKQKSFNQKEIDMDEEAWDLTVPPPLLDVNKKKFDKIIGCGG